MEKMRTYCGSKTIERKKNASNGITRPLAYPAEGKRLRDVQLAGGGQLRDLFELLRLQGAAHALEQAYPRVRLVVLLLAQKIKIWIQKEKVSKQA